MNTDSNEFKPAKRRKKDGVDTRAERKRELDRIAQRATRERTKNKIADLEQRLASLESGDRNSEISRLTKTVAELRQENERYQTALVKMRFAINEALGETEGSNRRDSASTGQTPPILNGASPASAIELPRHDSVVTIESISSPTNPGPVVPNFSQTLTQAQDQRVQTLYETHGYRSPTPHSSDHVLGNVDLNSVYEFFEWGMSNPFSHPSPLTGRLPPSSESALLAVAPDEHKWKTSDDAFHRGLQANPSGIPWDLDESLLARAILLGWDSIGPAINHPILFTLHCVDQRVFGKWTSRPQRLALMYICGLAMIWRASPTPENKAKVPPWFLPRPAQDRIEHPLVIDFLVWPGLRERLVFEYEKYTMTGEFSFCFVEYFHFDWPYPDEQVAQYDPRTGGLICGLSKLFREQVFDLKNWTMERGFFESFPEMRADIDEWAEHPGRQAHVTGPRVPTVGYQKTGVATWS